jgi:hypothetical protein
MITHNLKCNIIKEIQRQLLELDRQYDSEMGELRRAYSFRRNQLLGALSKFPVDVRGIENRINR